MTHSVFFHVGLPKCATTTVQNYLHEKRSDLAALGFHYNFAPSQKHDLRQGNGAEMADAIVHDARDRLEQLLAFHLQGDGDVLISSEAFSAVFQTKGMGQLADQLRAKGYQPKVIVYVRRQDLWIESDYKQQIKGGRDWMAPIQDLLAMRLDQLVLNYAWTMAYWAKHVGAENVSVVVLDKGQPSDYPVRRLLELVGASALIPEGPIAIDMANVSPPTGLIEPARLLKQEAHAAGLDADQTRAVLQRFFDHAPRLVQVPERRFLLSFDERQALLMRVRGSNADLARIYCGGKGFDTEVLQHRPSEDPLLPEAQEVLTAYKSAMGQDALSMPSRGKKLMRRLGFGRTARGSG